HPGGSLGKRLYLKVKDLYPSNTAPKVSKNTDLRKVILEITSNRLGAAAVVDGDKLIGIVTDGDLRRMLLDNRSIEGLKAFDIMSINPKSAEKDMLAIDALAVMKEYNISQLLITEKGKYVGMVHLHDIIKEGIL
ncbi:MAG: CBS domain-containing protein, partial [Bacteroidota bacterium]